MIHQHSDTKEPLVKVLLCQLEVGDEFFMFENVRFRMYEEGAKRISDGGTPEGDFQQFDPKDEALAIIFSRERFEKFSHPCPKCGNMASNSAKYCNQCGAELSPTGEPDPNYELKLCSKMGHLLQIAIADAKFCARCRCELIVI